MRAAYDAHREDDDFVQAGSLVRDVLDEAARARLASNIVAHVRQGVHEPVLGRVLDYWRRVDANLGAEVAKGLNGG